MNLWILLLKFLVIEVYSRWYYFIDSDVNNLDLEGV